jgi:hypothetical protein
MYEETQSSPGGADLATEAESKEKTWWIGPSARVDNNLTICPLQSRLQHIYHGHWAWATLCQSHTLSPSQGQIQAPAGRYDNPIPTRFLAPIDFLQNTGLVLKKKVSLLDLTKII